VEEIEARTRSKLMSLAGAILTAAGALGQGRPESAYEILREVRDELDEVIGELASELSGECQEPTSAAEDFLGGGGALAAPRPPGLLGRLYLAAASLPGGEWS